MRSRENEDTQADVVPHRLLAELSEEERARALERFALLRPCLQEGVSQAAVARMHQLALGSVQRWVRQYRQDGLVGLARRRRSDRGKRRALPQECVSLIEGLALQRPRHSVAHIHRTISRVVVEKGWPTVSYGRVYAIITALDPELMVLAQEGSRVYQDRYDLLFLHEVSRPNERWQADHCLLPIWLLNDQGKPARPYLTIILDEYSRAVMGYRLSFDVPSAFQTGLTLRQAIWTKHDPVWPVCGIPDAFYTDHGCDFTSKHLEQIAANLPMQLIFSQPGRPRGRGKIERFFRTVKQMVLPGLPGAMVRVQRTYRSARKRQRSKGAMDGQSQRQATLTLAQFDTRFRTWVVESYHHRTHRRLKAAPLARWQQGTWLPRLPVSQSQLDLLLLREGASRLVHQEGIFFRGSRYMDTNLAGWVGKTVSIYADPSDLAIISVYVKESPTEERFLCEARCQEVDGQRVSRKEIVAARDAQRKDLHAALEERAVARAPRNAQNEAQGNANDPAHSGKGQVSPGLQFVPPPFMAHLSADLLPEGGR